MGRPRRLLRRPRAALAIFLETEASSGYVLAAGALVALVWANLLPGYETFWHRELGVGPLTRDLQHWVNDGLMAIFFFVVGMEIKRELVVGELSSVRLAMLPAFAAVGGMVAPAGIYLALNAGHPSVNGWGIPMATDIAFVLGAMGLLGRRIPNGLKVFVLTLAIVDDIGAIAVIAIVYTRELQWAWFALAAAAIGVIFVLRRAAVVSPWVYLAPGIAMWFSAFQSGVHPTIAGVALGLLVPPQPAHGRPVMDQLQSKLHPVSSFVVMPLFAVANAGVLISGDSFSDALGSRIFWGVGLGLVVGKLVGIVGASSLTEVLRLGRRPARVNRRHIAGGAALSGIGFTVALFIAGLAFSSAGQIEEAKLAILAGSTVAALAGAAILAVPAGKRARSGT